MEVVSTNKGEKRKVEYRGKEIYTGIFKYSVNEGIKLGLTDVEGDSVIDRRFHGGVDKACYLYSTNHYAFWKTRYPNLDWQWGMFGENLSVSNLDESEIHIGDILKVGSALVQVTQPRQPCYKLGIRMKDAKAVREFIHAELPGVYVRVLNEGIVKSGDELCIEQQVSENFTVKELYHLLYNAKENIETVKKAIQMKELADSCRSDLKRMARI